MVFNQNNQPHSNDDMSVQEHLLATLKMQGLVFPETEEELDLFLQAIEKINEPMPKEFENPLEIVKRGKFKRPPNFKLQIDSQDNDFLAMAAREGGIIPDEILKIMEHDRKKSENESNEQMG